MFSTICWICWSKWWVICGCMSGMHDKWWSILLATYMTISENFPRLTLPSLRHVICRSWPEMKSNTIVLKGDSNYETRYMSWTRSSYLLEKQRHYIDKGNSCTRLAHLDRPGAFHSTQSTRSPYRHHAKTWVCRPTTWLQQSFCKAWTWHQPLWREQLACAPLLAQCRNTRSSLG